MSQERFFRAMRAIEYTARHDDVMQYDDTTAYNTEDRGMTGEDWTAVNDIFGTDDTVIERYVDGMVDGNICHRI